jgi:hypothetical protein
MRSVTAFFDRHPFLALVIAAGAAILGCSGTSPAANPKFYGRFDATADDASAAEAADGDSEEANRAVDAGLDVTSADDELLEAAVEDASTDRSTEAGTDAALPEATAPPIDAGSDADDAAAD